MGRRLELERGDPQASGTRFRGPGRAATRPGPTIDSGYLKDFLSTIEGPIVLAAHSYGGFVVSDAATGNKNVKALVFVDAFAPDKGRPWSRSPPAPARFLSRPWPTHERVQARAVPGAPEGAVDAYVLRDVFIPGFANGLPRRQAEVLAVTQTALATNALGSRPPNRRGRRSRHGRSSVPRTGSSRRPARRR
ncbi:alpha/beta hydrolase [Micromonospora sp. M12]